MRVDVAERTITLSPGQPGQIELEVYNGAEVIDGLSARVVGLHPTWVRTDPAQLPLFPGLSGRITVEITLPTTFPAGTHQLVVEIVSSVDPDLVRQVDLEMVVLPLVEATLYPVPPTRGGRRKARFSIHCENTGNTPVELRLDASDPERALRYTFRPQTLHVEAGASAAAVLDVKGKGRIAGADVARPIDILGWSPELELETRATFQQRPILARGLLTALVLAAIVLLWAGAFLFGLAQVLEGDELTKSAPPSFFAAATAASAAADGGDAAAAGPVGAVAKSGAAKGVGGSVAGVVTAGSTGTGLGRITVEAIRETKAGPRLVSSAATQDDGTFVIEGLFPGRYKLRFTALGFEETWYPGVPDAASAEEIQVGAQQASKGLAVAVEGLPGSLTGRVDTGDIEAPVPVTVTVRSLAGEATAVVATVTTDGFGGYTVPNLATPAEYELSFTAPGYLPTTLLERVGGGDAHTVNTVRLSAGTGSIAGVVRDAFGPVGGVVVTTTVNGEAVTTATPTAGTVGRFVLGNLPTPGTYLLTFAKAEFGAQTIAVALGPGESLDNVDTTLIPGTGTISGIVVDDGGRPLGGAKVDIGGGAEAITTKTLTAGAVGTFLVAGLPAPGTYTLTFSAEGFASETIQVQLIEVAAADGVSVKLVRALGSVRGSITGADGKPLQGVAVKITDGTTEREAKSTSTPPGGYSIGALPPGAYSVTYTLDGYVERTALVQVGRGQDVVQDVVLTAKPT